MGDVSYPHRDKVNVFSEGDAKTRLSAIKDVSLNSSFTVHKKNPS